MVGALQHLCGALEPPTDFLATAFPAEHGYRHLSPAAHISLCWQVSLGDTLSLDINDRSLEHLLAKKANVVRVGSKYCSPKLATPDTLKSDAVAHSLEPGVIWKTFQEHAGLTDTAEPWPFRQ